jgi:hypothetical protein
MMMARRTKQLARERRNERARAPRPPLIDDAEVRRRAIERWENEGGRPRQDNGQIDRPPKRT